MTTLVSSRMKIDNSGEGIILRDGILGRGAVQQRHEAIFCEVKQLKQMVYTSCFANLEERVHKFIKDCCFLHFFVVIKVEGSGENWQVTQVMKWQRVERVREDAVHMKRK